ncbi:hypothetical protein AMATHDRAFT_64876 [Amanita thiersii Skay4041]|uniref:Small ribosomal subunit protein uS5m n=1 Tax=Amanita thiersii Skay4041 TaxID=703135 RepID=A0A2A9NK43_9AGAR|nr:hypothetical protein AMATHDRAFT_64876 [Amanita thiersii Skay4041]
MSCLAGRLLRYGLLRSSVSTTTTTTTTATAAAASTHCCPSSSSSSKRVKQTRPVTFRTTRTHPTRPTRTPPLHSIPIRAYSNGESSNKNGRDVPSAPEPPTPPKSMFDRLFASLRPEMEDDELAVVVAGLLLTADSVERLSLVQETIPEYLQGRAQDALYEKVNRYMSSPPKELQAEIEKEKEQAQSRSVAEREAEAAAEKAAKEQEVAEENKATSLPHIDPAELEGKPMLHQLNLQLHTMRAQHTLSLLSEDEKRELEYLLSQVVDTSGMERTGPMIAVANFLKLRGLEIVFKRKDEPVAKLGEETKAADGMNAVEYAKRAAKDVTLNPIETRVEEKNDPYPNLMTPDPLLDARDEMVFPPTEKSPYTNRVIIRNHSSIFHAAMEQQTPPNTDPFEDPESTWEPEQTDETAEDLESFDNLPIPEAEIRNLYRFPLISRRVTQQTGKGKIHRIQYLVVVGNGDGLVGYGQAKDEDSAKALSKATALAIRSMDTVARFEKRTVPTEMETKLGSTRIIMRPRPVGFGLRCNPNLHQVLKAAGIKDVSAKVWGSRNPVNVVKAAFRMLWGGHAPLGMGDGVGGKGRTLDKGEGVRHVQDVERDRGRKLISLRK